MNEGACLNVPRSTEVTETVMAKRIAMMSTTLGWMSQSLELNVELLKVLLLEFPTKGCPEIGRPDSQLHGYGQSARRHRRRPAEPYSLHQIHLHSSSCRNPPYRVLLTNYWLYLSRRTSLRYQTIHPSQIVIVSAAELCDLGSTRHEPYEAFTFAPTADTHRSQTGTAMAALYQDSIVLFGDSLTQMSWNPELGGVGTRVAGASSLFDVSLVIDLSLARRSVCS